MDTSRKTPARSDGRAEIFIVLLLAIVIGGAILWAFTRPEDDTSQDAASTTTTTSAGPTETTLPAPRAYKVTDGVNVRSGPGTTFGVVAQVQVGNDVLVVCHTEGQAITAPSGSTNQWVRVTVDGKNGYVSAAYVDTKGDLVNPAIIGVCPPS